MTKDFLNDKFRGCIFAPLKPPKPESFMLKKRNKLFMK
ncbi:MAG: hypothetical protein ACI9JY_003040, partial [Saprospiraceae bacterium]